ncbi:hypothetical protein LSH36_67g04024 [Paralvinella palmiformis]|uniref:Golgi apparatus membrane protein TVP23 homolog n=1 Tax=Paralvinella palmiformis TaxID=53620 RepID=A0AAD9NDH2_9ANNE|nr:hypothetical protein LSH36_67g04024 [Paralvinella palmiformis]
MVGAIFSTHAHTLVVTLQKMDAVDDTEDVALNFGEEDDVLQKKRFRHPLAVFFHLVFRVLAIVTYLLCGWFSNSFIINFVIIVLLLSMDFWTVKNITGRLLVGLRWWNQIDEDGKSQWVFESRKVRINMGAAKSRVTAVEARIFWMGLVVCPIFWVLFLFGTIFTLKFKWFVSIWCWSCAYSLHC